MFLLNFKHHFCWKAAFKVFCRRTKCISQGRELIPVQQLWHNPSCWSSPWKVKNGNQHILRFRLAWLLKSLREEYRNKVTAQFPLKCMNISSYFDLVIWQLWHALWQAQNYKCFLKKERKISLHLKCCFLIWFYYLEIKHFCMLGLWYALMIVVEVI